MLITQGELYHYMVKEILECLSLIEKWLPQATQSLKRKCRHFDEILITGCTGSCHFDNFQCSQWWKFHQNEDVSVSVIRSHRWWMYAFAMSFSGRKGKSFHNVKYLQLGSSHVMRYLFAGYKGGGANHNMMNKLLLFFSHVVQWLTHTHMGSYSLTQWKNYGREFLSHVENWLLHNMKYDLIDSKCTYLLYHFIGQKAIVR